MHSRTPLANTYDFNSIMLNSVCFGFFSFYYYYRVYETNETKSREWSQGSIDLIKARDNMLLNSIKGERLTCSRCLSKWIFSPLAILPPPTPPHPSKPLQQFTHGWVGCKSFRGTTVNNLTF